MAEGIRTVTEPSAFRPILAGTADPSDPSDTAGATRPNAERRTPNAVVPPTIHHPPSTAGANLLDLMAQRRSIRRLRSGPFPESTQARLHESVRLTPAAFNVASTHVVFVHAERAALWRTVEAGFRERLDGDRQERYLDRLAGFRDGVGAALIFEDTSARAALVEAWNITDAQALAFAEQGLGMVQLALWLALTAEGLVTSLQHWEWLLEDRIAAFANVPPDRFRLAAVLPIGYPDEDPRTIDPIALDRVVSRDRHPG